MNDILGAEAQIPYRGYSEIEWEAKTFLENNWNDGFPIEVDEICDRLNIGVIYIPNLKKQFSLDAYTTSDFKSIVVDEGILSDDERYRLCIAHELGHMTLHKDYYPSNIHDLETYLKYANGFICGPAESQADIFALALLIPDYELKKQLIRKFGKNIEFRIRELTLSRTTEKFIEIANYFGVSNTILRKRIEHVFPDIILAIKSRRS